MYRLLFQGFLWVQFITAPYPSAHAGPLYLRSGEPVSLAVPPGSAAIKEPGEIRWFLRTATESKEMPALRGQTSFLVTDVADFKRPGSYHIAFATGERNADDLESFFELVLRRDNSYTGLLTELLGVPFVETLPPATDGIPAPDARLATNCAGVAVYGRRRMGYSIPYLAPAGLYPYLRSLGRNEELRVGDIIHFGFQTAVLSVDRPPVGRLDPGDSVIHAFYAPVEEVRFGDLAYKKLPRRIYRWKN